MDSPPEAAAPARPWARAQVMLPVFAPLSLIGGLLPSFSLAGNLYVLALGGGMLVAGMSSRLPRRAAPAGLLPGVVWWLLPIAIFAAVEVFTFAMGATEDYPTLSLLADPVLDGYAARSLAYFGWLAAFWALVRR
ncbi:hypothetical protein Cs7R123_70940 [Catellatospora sp. TT07R-123]|uniref:hypothetical protein n=1 Tax=Catellatospora sp. TT07R-123 TaxID=2733863 RepID=UPI001B1DDD26|nr:hypothetical protein [Catellatospora sp. TT07R-123]GHJ49752.1 hypothetical protein Cs7R123_70940 [Catellatospora sp. TT07R-123]